MLISIRTVVAAAACAMSVLGATAAANDTGFTYQGSLSDAGSAVTGSVSVSVSLWDSETLGTQIGSTQALPAVTVTDGIFSIELDFGASAFNGDRWMEISIDSNVLTPRQRVTATPYAIQTRGIFVDDAGHVAIGHSAPERLFHLRGGDLIMQTDDDAVGGQSILFQKADGNFATRLYQVPGDSSFKTDFRISQGDSTNPGSFIDQIIIRDGLGDNLTRIGIGDHVPTAHLDVRSNGVGQTTLDVRHQSSETNLGAIRASVIAPDTTAIYAESSADSGTSTRGVTGLSRSPDGQAILGRIDVNGGSGVGAGVWGDSDVEGGRGVYGLARGTIGVSYGVYGDSGTNFNNFGVFANGKLGASGFKTFRIDHPLDPANSYLQHYSSEGPEPINEYSGNAILGADGAAWVQLPSYFEAINIDFRYSLTAIGSPAPGLYIAQEVTNNIFRIAGGQPGMKVSWEVKARRNDPYARAYAAPVELEKQGRERGRYLQPQLYGQPASKGMTPPQSQVLDHHADLVND
ncbi:MAG: hypothetical protein AB8F26_13385 [Phycisphaerales bacterium]